nr:O-methyl transferase [Streptomyces sp.]
MSATDRAAHGRERQAAAQLLGRVVTGIWTAHAGYAAVKLRVADRLTELPRPAQEIAAEVGADPGALARLLRTLAALGVFTEGPAGHFALNDTGRQLRTDSESPLGPFLELHHEIFRPWHAELLHTVRTGQPAAEKVYGMPFFAHLERDPAAGKVFHDALARSLPLLVRAALADGVFDGIGSLADLGGGDGALVELALQHDPALRATLLERPEALAGARERLAAAGVADRCTFAEGSFFETAPKDHDAYVIARCLHNWPDDRAARILRTVRAVMRDDARLLLFEQVVSSEPGFDMGKCADLTMMLIGGRERTRAEHEDLLASAGLRLREVRGVSVAGTPKSHVLVAVPD